ncbi:MAG TPA: glycosyltransferase [Lysobacter sp.]
MLVVDARSPRPEIDSGSVRMVALLRLFSELGLPPAFVADDFRSHAIDAPLVRTDDVRDARSATAWLDRHATSLQLVLLSRHTVASHWLPLVRARLPGVPVIFDTVDLHFVREFRQADLARSTALRLLAATTRRRELELVDAADRTWVVSRSEREHLEVLRPGSRVDCVSNIVDPHPDPPAMNARTDYVFVGNFRHEPNVDAAKWLESIWPRLHRRRPEARLLIVGPSMPGAVAARLASLQGVEVLGHVPDLDAVLMRARVMLAPLRYGAGVKGKINAAFACGLPVVATSCAVEGMQLDDKQVALVADDETDFVVQAARLYDDGELWLSCRDAGTESLTRYFSTQAARTAIVDSLQRLGIVVSR